MKGRIRCGALLFACAFLLVLPSAASAKLFLEFDSANLRGESTVAGFEDQIEARSFQFGIGKSSKDKPASFSEITISKDLDRASPELMLRVASGAIIPSAKVRFTKSSDGGETTFLRYCFTGVRITGFSQSSGGDRPSESISFSYGTIVQSYTQQNATGGVVGVFSSGWDVLKNLQFGGACDN
jgi:type VI secretion system secreted protein Hcp